MESYNELMDDIAWFLFELLVLGYVYDPATAKSFHIPAGCGWEAYVEVSQTLQHCIYWCVTLQIHFILRYHHG